MTDRRSKTVPSALAGRPGRRISPWRLWGFRLAAVAVSFVLLGFVELLLVAFGFGHDTSLVIKVAGEPRRAGYQFNEWVDLPYYGVHPLRGPEERRFDLPKSEGTFRVVVFGGSTVFGFPYQPELAFPRQLEVALQRQHDGVQVEVLNAGITGINSFGIADLVRQGIRAAPDLIIIHTGHNEFYGPGGVASTTLDVSPSLFPSIVRFRRLRLFQAFSALLRSPGTGLELPAGLAFNVSVQVDGSLDRKAEQRYRANLTQIVQTAQTANIPILLTTVACNLRDQSPIRSPLRIDLSFEAYRRWHRLFLLGEQQMDNARSGEAKQWGAALDSLRQAARIDDSSAILAYRIAQCLEALERWNESRRTFERARDLDGCPFRARGPFAAIVRDVVKNARDEHVLFFDLATELQELSGDKAVGYDWLLEHVHYNYEGHWQVGLLLARFVHTSILGGAWDGDRVPSLEQRDELLGVVPQDHLGAHSFALQLLDTSPIDGASDIQRHVQFIKSRIQALYVELVPQEREFFADATMIEIGTDLLRTLGERYVAEGLRQQGLRLLERNVRRRPWSAEAHLALARCLLALGERGKAREVARDVLELAPHAAESQELLDALR